MSLPKYRTLAAPELEALKEVRRAFPSGHAFYRSAQLVSHLSYRGPHEVVGWYAGTAAVVLRRAEELGVAEGMELPVAMGIALGAVHNELRDARVDFGDDLADRIARLVADLEAAMGVDGKAYAGHGAHVEWPTIEWVRASADLTSGVPNGSPIVMRHFDDCKYWADTGESCVRASDAQMVELPACVDCVFQARLADNPRSGPRLGNEGGTQTTGIEIPMPSLLGVDETDVAALSRVRAEQRYLRQYLLGGASEAGCDLCGRLLPSSLLVAAHIVPRRELNGAQRLDFSRAAMLACALGCDALFEYGYLTVGSDGVVQAGKQSSAAVAVAVDELSGRKCTAFNENTAANFDRHAQMHADSW
ncbi:hypothetical protein [Nocardioides sp. AE5]|uniref:hypothetical protein n=1 Tax=Nocardioides sp. AE5 TaxID=2962573 RepID=UPI002880DA4E|nr:hypothetical protein [Nocardioides sp. AE5]MDT0202739.1 hypothetical protein [Nocardioides sp. AE5]